MNILTIIRMHKIDKQYQRNTMTLSFNRFIYLNAQIILVYFVGYPFYHYFLFFSTSYSCRGFFLHIHVLL
jgi:hypothetical protein